MKRWKGWDGRGQQIIVIVVCLLLISCTCLIISVESSENALSSHNDPTSDDYLSTLRSSLKNVANSFKSDPLTSLEPLQKTLNQQEAVLNDLRTDLSDILKLFPSDQPNIAKRSLKSTAEELPSCPSISPSLRRVLSVNQVKCHVIFVSAPVQRIGFLDCSDLVFT